MNMFIRSTTSALLSALLLTVSTHLLASNDEIVLYRYINNQGAKVVAYSIPPEFVGRGYEVISRQGMVLEVVAPEPTEEERAEQKLAEQQQEKLDKWDRRLTRRYSYVSDIESAKDRKLAKITASTNLMQNHIDNINREIEKHQATAASQERRNGTVSPEILDIMDSLFTERMISEQKIENARADHKSESAKFNKDIERFKVIQMREANARTRPSADK